MNILRIGTRGSELAIWQAKYVSSQLQEHHSDLEVEICYIKTEGDKRTDVPLTEIGGKNLFVKELEVALLDGRIDIAVHSMKDVTVNLRPEFDIPVILQRENPCDALVSNSYKSLEELPLDATIGTSSLRRQSQLLMTRKDLNIKTLRGNVQTRLKRLDEGSYDAIILAVAGLKRLELEYRITQELPVEHFVPSPGQGALGVECRANDDATHELILPLDHSSTHTLVNAERIVNRRLGGSCFVPLGVHAQSETKSVNIHAYLGDPLGSRNLSDTVSTTLENCIDTAETLAENLLSRGAREILET